MKVVSAERAVEVVLRLDDAAPCTPPDGREMQPQTVKLLYVGNGYVRIEVHGRTLRRNAALGTRAAGHWDHGPGGSARARYDTSYAPDWLRELAERYAPPDFTAVS